MDLRGAYAAILVLARSHVLPGVTTARGACGCSWILTFGGMTIL